VIMEKWVTTYGYQPINSVSLRTLSQEASVASIYLLDCTTATIIAPKDDKKPTLRHNKAAGEEANASSSIKLIEYRDLVLALPGSNQHHQMCKFSCYAAPNISLRCSEHVANYRSDVVSHCTSA
jgi:hypothetical protein